MNILKRSLLQQITSKSEVFRGVCRMQQLQIHNIHNGRIFSNLTRVAKAQSIEPYSNYFMENAVKRQYSTEESRKISPNSWWGKFLGRLKTSKSVILGKSSLVYAKTVNNLKYSDFAVKFNMPNTFNTWFLVTEVHVWMLMVRAMAEKENGKAIRDAIVTEMWTDALKRAVQMAPGSSRLIKNQLLEISDQFQYAIIAYDEGLTTDDQQLASALWVRFFNSNCDNYAHIELLIKYIRYNIAQLDKLNPDEFLNKQKYDWPLLTDFENGKY